MLCYHGTSLILRKRIVQTVASHAGKGTNAFSENDNTTPPYFRNNDWIGPINKLSNIRFIEYKRTENESNVERAYRNMKEDNLKWNHEFWEEQNKCFIKAKDQFTAQMFKLKGSSVGMNEDGTKMVLSTDEMAQFYRLFLEEQKERMTKYNKDWYRRNVATILPGFRVFLHHVTKKLFS
ncbi:COA8 family protein CBG23705, mitochondrial-like [Antedon mediterranea]|uniref:COA8 family protein CBG23705, mitochondrial-like n=1 Tax=Antedon mediterranea TaxID=105859 RepID=UPI003AF5AB11